MASRVLGMGDVLSLIEKAEEAVSAEDAEKLEEKIRKNAFTLEDFRDQLRTIRKMGPLEQILGMLPGMGNMKELAANREKVDDKSLGRVEAIINSMTAQERRNHQLLNGSRRKRIAIYLRDDFMCCYCGVDLKDAAPEEMGLDHLKCQVDGGSHDESNLVTACRSCNSSRRDTPWRQYATGGAVTRIRRNIRRKLNLKLASALQEEGAVFRLMPYPGHAHGIRGQKAQLHVFKTITDFFEDELR